MTDKIIIPLLSLKHMFRSIPLFNLCIIFVDYIKNKNQCWMDWTIKILIYVGFF